MKFPPAARGQFRLHPVQASGGVTYGIGTPATIPYTFVVTVVAGKIKQNTWYFRRGGVVKKLTTTKLGAINTCLTIQELKCYIHRVQTNNRLIVDVYTCCCELCICTPSDLGVKSSIVQMIVHGTCDLDKKEQDRLYMCDVPILKSN